MATNRSRGSDLEDPLQAFSGLSLLSRTLKSLSDSPLPPPPSDPHDLLHIHNLLDSMPLQSPIEPLEHAKIIVESSSEFLNPAMPTNVAFEVENEGVEANTFGNQRERRPGLGRKRARFSLKPTTNQPPASFEPSFDVGKYQDPEDFFLAYEKFENAKQEWQKQTGNVLKDANQNQPATRTRRPGISGRKPVKYKHRYSTDATSEDAFEEEILSPPDHSLQQRTSTTHITSQDRELADSIINTETMVDGLLDELLTCSQDQLDEDGVISLLEERLQIKPIDVEKLSLPELLDIRKIDLKASRGNLKKPRTVFSDIQNMLKGTSSETASKSSQSPSPLKSPLASIASLQKRVLQSNPQKDRFSFLDTDNLFSEDAATRSISKQSDQVDAGRDLNICSKSSSLTINNNASDVANVSPSNVGTGDIASPSAESVNHSSSALDSDLHASMRKSHLDAKGKDRVNSVDNSVVDPNLHAVEPNNSDNMVEGMLQGDVAIERHGNNVEDTTLEKSDGILSRMDKSDTFAAEAHFENESSTPAEGAQEQHAKENESSTPAEGAQELQNKANESWNPAGGLQETHNKEDHSSRVQGNKQNKKTYKGRESRAFSRRKSLAAAGTKWESGVRRSTRIKSRPLEYWKGERFLYGRINESLATVIGIKYESPGKGEGNPALKVKSFVGDEYKDLVEVAALH